MDIKKIKASKKGVVHTWADYFWAIVGGAIIFGVAFLWIGLSTASAERQIKAQTFDIKSEETLVFYLSNYVVKDETFKGMLGDERYKIAAQLADSKMTFADLIRAIGDNDDEDYKEILKWETGYMFNTMLGDEKWKLDITFPDGSVLSYGGFKGETRIFEVNIPATGYQLINVKLTVKKEMTA